MRFLAAIALVLAISGTAHAQQESGTLNNCTANGTACTPSPVYNLRQKAVGIRLLGGTMTLSLQCQLVAGGEWFNVTGGGTISATTMLDFETPCHAVRIFMTTCTGCSYSAVYRGFRRGE
jgi:hypothetical protein